MKRSNSSELASETKRFEASYPPPTPFQQQQQLQVQAQQQLQAQQQQQYQAQQQQQFQQQMQAAQQQQMQAAQQQQMQAAQQQQIQAVQQQQQQFAANQQFYNQAYYPINSVNYSPYVPPQPPMLYNSSPSWNFMSSPPPFYPTSPASGPPLPPSQPPLPPPEMKPEKPPLPKEPEPGGSTFAPTETVASEVRMPSAPSVSFPGMGMSRAPPPLGGLRMRVGMNGGFNGYNPAMGMRGLVGGRPSIMGPNGSGMMHGMNMNQPPMRGRRGGRNAHYFQQMPTPQLLVPPIDLQRMGEISDFGRLFEEDQPAGPEKLTIFLNNTDNGRVQVNKKAKRKPMSTRYARTKKWKREDAIAAIAVENDNTSTLKRPMVILRFPDPEISKFSIKKLSPFIDTVHFQQPSTPRYCFVQLKEGSDVEKVMSTIRQIPFGTGTISCELKNPHLDDQPVTPEEIDPYTLYIGNLPTQISVRVIKEYFPNAQRIDIGYAQRMRFTRYAFIRYNTVEEAMASYKSTVHALLDSRSLIVRFRRQKGNIGLPGETKLNAPRREGREVLPDMEPKPLEHGYDVNEMVTFPEGLEPIELDADDEEEDDSAQPEQGEMPLKKILLKPFASTSTPPRAVTPPVSAPSASVSHQQNDIRSQNDTCTQDDKCSQNTTPPQPEESSGVNGSSQVAAVTNNTAAQNENPDQPSTSKASKAGEVPTTDATTSSTDGGDNKEKVLQEANALMRKNIEDAHEAIRRKFIEREVLSLPNLQPARPGDVKLEDSDTDDSSDDGINLLGTRVKEEPSEDHVAREQLGHPTLDDLYLDDYEYDDLDCEPEEEDDDWETSSEVTSKSTCANEWDAIRRNELNTKEDKPDLDQLGSLRSLFQSAPIPVAPIPATIEPKTELDDLFNPKQKKMDTNKITEKDELAEMFAQLNSDPECDDEDAFFG